MGEPYTKDGYLGRVKLCVMTTAIVVIATFIMGNSIHTDIAIYESYQSGDYFVDIYGAISRLYTWEVLIIVCLFLEFIITFMAVGVLIKVGGFAKGENEISAMIPVLMAIVLILVIICVIAQIRALNLMISIGF